MVFENNTRKGKSFIRSLYHRFGWLGTGILMVPVLFWVWIAAREPFISLFSGSVPRYLISGRIFSEPFDIIHAGFAMDQPTIGKWLFWFTFMMITSLPYSAAVRWLCDRSKRSVYFIYGISNVILCIFLLSILTWPVIWLIQYVNSMGSTPKRTFGLLYSVCVCATITGFLIWTFRKPKRTGIQAV